MPLLIKAKAYGIHQFGHTIRKHNQAYDKAWISQTEPKTESLLGTMDNSSLSDINGSYGPLQSMQLVPVNYRMVAMNFGLNLLPFIPLVFIIYSPVELFKTLMQAVFTA